MAPAFHGPFCDRKSYAPRAGLEAVKHLLNERRRMLALLFATARLGGGDGRSDRFCRGGSGVLDFIRLAKLSRFQGKVRIAPLVRMVERLSGAGDSFKNVVNRVAPGFLETVIIGVHAPFALLARHLLVSWEGAAGSGRHASGSPSLMAMNPKSSQLSIVSYHPAGVK